MASTAKKTAPRFTDEERSAMKERARELKAGKTDPEAEVEAKIAEMRGLDRKLAERIHALVKTAAPELAPKTWYGMPAYARQGKIVCWFQPAAKFKSRYATFSFTDAANLDEGRVWPVSYALSELNRADEKRIADLIKQALS